MKSQKEWLDLMIAEIKEEQSFEEHYTKLDYIENVFNISSYDSDIGDKIISKLLNVIEHILDRKTFDLVDSDKYEEFITFLHVGNLYDYLEWGSSIRGAWLCCDNEFNTCLHNNDGDFVLITETADLINFMRAIIQLYKIDIV